MKFARLRTLSLCVALACLTSLATAQNATPRQDAGANSPTNEALRQELIRMLDEDQAARKPMMDGTWTSEEQGRRIRALDAANTKRLTEIVKQYGFPGVALVGKDGAQAAFVMLIHGPSIELQKKSLPYIKKAALRGEIPIDAFASLTDTILSNEDKPQIYGTKFDLADGKFVLAKTKDPARLDARRKKLGLAPISEYAKGLSELYKMPVDASIPR
ncbi:MAG: hypothetical protein H7Z38_06325 [Rubrivivax sp.]|nr:hypothetical protein [Pyrinomonadaceae bacterium]